MTLQELPVDWEELAKVAYRAYGEVTDFKNFQGNPMPDWNDLTPTIQQAWQAAVKKSVSVFVHHCALDDRQLATVRHAFDYEEHHASAGVPGHNQFLLIARLARWLGF